MGIETKYPAHPDLTSGEETDLHSHAGAGGATLTVAEAEVFSGTAPTVWTDLDLSGTVGANAALVLIKVFTSWQILVIAVRKNGDTDDFYNANTPANSGFGVAEYCQGAGSKFAALLVATDDAGKIEWIAERAATDATIDIMAYIK